MLSVIENVVRNVAQHATVNVNSRPKSVVPCSSINFANSTRYSTNGSTFTVTRVTVTTHQRSWSIDSPRNLLSR